jgi:hypothetical protein
MGRITSREFQEFPLYAICANVLNPIVAGASATYLCIPKQWVGSQKKGPVTRYKERSARSRHKHH